MPNGAACPEQPVIIPPPGYPVTRSFGYEAPVAIEWVSLSIEFQGADGRAIAKGFSCFCSLPAEASAGSTALRIMGLQGRLPSGTADTCSNEVTAAQREGIGMKAFEMNGTVAHPDAAYIHTPGTCKAVWTKP